MHAVSETGNRPRRAPQALGSVIPGVLAELGLDGASAAVELLRVWPEVLGEELRPHCAAEGLRRGVVHASVRDSGWMQRIQMEKPRILEGLQRALGAETVQELRLRIARGP
jgi:predicted nucleic acid-binding Zn ribbon protein